MAMLFPIIAGDAVLRANETPLSMGGRWTAMTGYSSLILTASSIRASAIATDCAMQFSGFPVSNDQSSGALISRLAVAGTVIYLFVRVTGNTYYRLTIAGPSGGAATCTVAKVIGGGAPVTIGTFSMTLTLFDYVTFQVVGTTLTVFQNFTQLFSQSDSAIASGNPGIGMNAVTSTTNARIVSWNGAGNAPATSITLGSPSFTDTFIRANESPINPTNWDTLNSGLPTNDQLEIVGNQCETTVTVQDDGTASLIPSLVNDQFNSIKVVALINNTSVVTYLRASPDLGNSYECFIVGITPNANNVRGVEISAIVAAGPNWDFIGFMPVNFVNGDTLAFAVVGSNSSGYICGFWNGLLIFQLPLSYFPNPATQPLSGSSGLQLANINVTPASADVAVQNFNAGPATSSGGSGGGNSSWLSIAANNILRGSRSH